MTDTIINAAIEQLRRHEEWLACRCEQHGVYPCVHEIAYRNACDRTEDAVHIETEAIEERA